MGTRSGSVKPPEFQNDGGLAGINLVERGEEIVITRHGKRVARLVSPTQALNRDRARAAMRRIRERAEKLKLGPFEWTEWKSFRDDGRP